MNTQPDFTSSGRSPDPQLEQVFTPTLATMRDWTVHTARQVRAMNMRKIARPMLCRIAHDAFFESFMMVCSSFLVCIRLASGGQDRFTTFRTNENVCLLTSHSD